MNSTFVVRMAILLVVAILIDLYAWKGLQTALMQHGTLVRRLVRIIYWSVSIGILVSVIWAMLNLQGSSARRDHHYMFSLVGIFLLFFLPKVVMVFFHGMDDLLHLLRWSYAKLFMPTPTGSTTGELIGRSNFLSQVGLIVAAVPFAGVLYGITKGRRSFNVLRVPVAVANLPAAFEGLRIVQISDTHLGSFGTDDGIVQHGVDLINEQNADIVVFTGDLVNDFVTEAEPYIETFRGIKAKLGKYAVLGNHDYSDYHQWTDPADKAANLVRLKEVEREMGFDLLIDEHRVLEKDGARFGLIGVQNWGTRFQQYGDLTKALRGTEDLPFRVLLSHDPTHWDAQVLGTGVDLTLSGHTHGAQLGVRIGHTTYSPAQWVYKQWAGLYTQGKQHLYVNRGFGFIGFPGRVGMPPEITVLELHRA